MSNSYGLDSHKLHFHPQRVAKWLDKENIYPIYMEISPYGTCNHRCTFCALDFMKYQKRYLNTPILKKRLSEMASLGLKSVMYAGEGEPFLNKEMVEIALHAKKTGLDQAFTTNGSLMTPEISEQILGVTSWIKVSCNAGSAQNYSAIHRTVASQYEKVWENLTEAQRIRTDNGYTCTLGMQILLLPENEGEVVELAKRARDTGLDYIVVKPYSQHPQSLTKTYSDMHYENTENLDKELSKLRTEYFNPIVRLHTIRKLQDKSRPYECCLGLPFWSYLDAGGNIWGCSMFLLDNRFLYGNIHDQTFEEIWTGPKRAKAMQWFNEHFDPSSCRINCRMDEINRYLWGLTHQPAHVNFI